MDSSTAWQTLRERVVDLSAINGIEGLLHWDQQVTMPRGGVSARGRQMALLAAVQHERVTDPRLREALDAATATTPNERAAIRRLRREVDRAVRTPASLVRRLAAAQAEGHAAWVSARESEDFSGFAAPLSELLRLNRELVAATRTDQADPYDVLLERYDPGSTVRELDPMFARLAAGLGDLLGRLDGRPHPEGFTGTWSVAEQKGLHAAVVRDMGFDLDEHGRLDDSVHPFTVGLDPTDVRLTHHLYADKLLSGLGGTIHEAGHGLYEQGLPTQLADIGLATPAGYGLHESQSRFWENAIGRSQPFSVYLRRQMGAHLSGPLPTAEQIFGASNRVERSLIRVFADEVTYNLHIIVRYRLERALFSGELPVAELPGAWDELYGEVVGIRPSKPTDGVLQDVHWSSGLLAYFPSYTLGNLYAASFAATMEAELPQMWAQVEQGQFGEILGWLRRKVHARGHSADAPEIVRDAVGERDHVADLLASFERRHGVLYGV